MQNSKFYSWPIVIALWVLGAISVLFGIIQLYTIQQGPPEVFDKYGSPQYFELPLPIVAHIISGCLFNLVAPLQFAAQFRQRHQRWHRTSGSLLILSGLIFALSALWMNQYYPPFGGNPKYSAIVVHCIIITTAFYLAIKSIRNGNVTRHRMWMMCAVAMALSPATQRLFILPYFIINGDLADWIISWSGWFGLSLNLSIVAMIILLERDKIRIPVSNLEH